MVPTEYMLTPRFSLYIPLWDVTVTKTLQCYFLIVVSIVLHDFISTNRMTCLPSSLKRWNLTYHNRIIYINTKKCVKCTMKNQVVKRRRLDDDVSKKKNLLWTRRFSHGYSKVPAASGSKDIVKLWRQIIWKLVTRLNYSCSSQQVRF